jgi:hypothetical protein
MKIKIFTHHPGTGGVQNCRISPTGWRSGTTGMDGGIMLAYRCPVTKKFVEATIKTPESKLRSLGSFQLPLWCRACHCAHAVSAQEIFVAEEA